MSLTLLHSPQKEPVTLADVKAFLRIEGSEEDEVLKHLIKTARLAIEAFTARSLIHQVWRFTVNAGFCIAKSDSGFLTVHHRPQDQGIELPRSPFVELLACPKLIDTYRQCDLKDYRLDTAGRVAKLYFGKTLHLEASRDSMIQIDFKAGYGLHHKDIPESIQHGILMMVAELFENRVSTNDNQGVPPSLNKAILQLIHPYRVQRLG